MTLVAKPERPHHHLRPVLRVQCAWCGGVIEEKAGDGHEPGVSHGICPPCAQRFFGITLGGEDG